jgi:hypothetical protein
MRGAIPPLTKTTSWRGCQVTKAQGEHYLYLTFTWFINRMIELLLKCIVGTTDLIRVMCSKFRRIIISFFSAFSGVAQSWELLLTVYESKESYSKRHKLDGSWW